MEKTHDNVWENCLNIIRDNVSSQSFKTWFEPIKPLKLQENILTIQVPSQFFYEWLEEHYITLLKKRLRKNLVRKVNWSTLLLWRTVLTAPSLIL